MEKAKVEQPSPVKREVMIRHLANLAIFHGGFWRGTYFHHGVPQPHSKTIPKTSGAHKSSHPISR